jgi:nucleotide-binding universal stress UspA family protein
MFARIVVPLDGSQTAAHALGYAAALGERFHAALTLVTVIAPSRSEVSGADVLGVTRTTQRAAHEQASATVERDVTDHLESVAAPLRARGIACAVALHHGNPAAEIIACAGDAPGTLIAMGTHGRTGVERWRLGSVAQHVVRHAAVPTLVVRVRAEDRPEAHPAVAEITVTLDGSPLAERALPAATALADAFGVPLVLLSVLPNRVDPPFTPATMKEERADAGAVEQYLARVVAQTTTTTRTVRAVLRPGAARQPDAVIRAYLARRPAGIVVMASHGRGGIRRWAMGSTAEGLIAASPQPVLIVRAGRAME